MAGDAARSAALRSTQNSLPSGSASTTQPEPSGRIWSSTRVAPMPSSRSTSSSRVRSAGCRSRCSRFFTALPSGTAMNSTSGPPGGRSIASVSPGKSSGCRGQSKTCDQKPASAYVS
ncbi:hypothetical protein DKT68_25425 [Micromonospora acroterricola]|uniref:Uncharacterized protein n=1 Tax=Micromonospora acroterricola TaxID=2202421 RepID=A0A317CUF6_9ACTN|nr:hypothetical protein DKT68_25425 [Micromonospora acroterricola]